jgi:hypothetical protein
VKPRSVIFAGLIMAIAVGAFVYLQQEPATKVAPQKSPTAASIGEVETRSEGNVTSATPAVFTRELPDPDDSTTPLLPALPLQKGELAWEARIRKVIETPGTNDTAVARALFEMLPGLPVEGRVHAAEEAIQRTSSAEYRAVAQPVISIPGTYPPSMIVLFSDLMERPPEVQLPTLLAIARNPEHPLSKQAQENLAFVLKQNAGTDWNRWEAAIREKLAARE